MEEEIKKQFEKQDKRFDELMEFLVGNVATKDDLTKLHEETKEEFRKVRSEIIDRVDGFVGLHQHLEVELAAVTNKTNRLESQIGIIAKHLQLKLQ